MHVLMNLPPLSLSVSLCVARFILEPKSVLMNEQEQKLKDSETALASLQVYLVCVMWVIVGSLL